MPAALGVPLALYAVREFDNHHVFRATFFIVLLGYGFLHFKVVGECYGDFGRTKIVPEPVHTPAQKRVWPPAPLVNMVVGDGVDDSRQDAGF